MSLKVTSKEKTIGTFIVKPSGTLDTNTYQILDKRIDMLLEASPKMIVFDMEELDYISSMGVRSVARTKKELKKIEGTVVLLNLKPQIKKVFDIIKALPKEQIFNNLNELDEYLDIMQKKAGE